MPERFADYHRYAAGVNRFKRYHRIAKVIGTAAYKAYRFIRYSPYAPYLPAMAPIKKHGSRSVSRGRKRSRTRSTHRSKSVPGAPRKKTKAESMSISRSRSRRSSRSMSRVRQEEEGGQHNDMSSSYVLVKNGKVPKKYRGVVKSSIQHQVGFQYKQSVTGSQFVYTIGSLVTRSQIVTPGTTTGTVTQDSWPGNPFEMNPYATNTGSNLLASIVSPSLDRCYLHNIAGEISMTGLETIAQEVTLYLVKHKISNNNKFEDEWASLLAASAQFNQPLAANPVGGGVATYGRPEISDYEQKPFGHPTMRKEFKVLAVRKHTLEPGSTHKLRYKIAYNRMLSKEYFTDSISTATPTEYLKGWSMSWVAIMKGAPVWNDALGIKKMTPGPVDVGFTHTYKVNFSYPMEKRLYAYRTDAGFVSASTLTDQKIIIDTDNITTVGQI